MFRMHDKSCPTTSVDFHRTYGVQTHRDLFEDLKTFIKRRENGIRKRYSPQGYNLTNELD